MKRLMLTLGSVAVTTAPIMTIACTAQEEDNRIIFDLRTVGGIQDIYSTFISSDTPGAVDGEYAFKINDTYLTNEWTAEEINEIKNTSMEQTFDLTDMELIDASDVMEDAFNNLPRLEDWDAFVGDATDGVLNKYLYYAADEVNADPDNDNGDWTGGENIKGHEIYDNSKDLIEDAFGTLPENLDLYHVERGGDSAKNLYFKLIDRDTNEILEDQFKIDVKWNSTQEEVNDFGNGFFSKLMDSGKELFARTKALFSEIVEKNDYTDFRPFIVDAIEHMFLTISDAIWNVIKPILAPFSLIPGANAVYSKLMDTPISKGETIIMTYIDDKFTY